MAAEWGICTACRKPRTSDQAFAWCGYVAHWVHEACAIKHRQELGLDVSLIRSGGRLECCAYHEGDQLLPSQHEGDFGWIRVEGATWPQRTPWTGKWLLFWPPNDVDDAWGWVRWGTLGGEHELGYAAKVGDRTNISARDGTHPCCVYTVDCRDVDDVERVLANLRRIGFNQKLFYKDDAATDTRRYGSAGVLYLATEGSTKLIQRRDPIPPDTESEPRPVAGQFAGRAMSKPLWHTVHST